MNSAVIITHALKDEQVNVVAMTEGLSYGGRHFHQTILCKRVVKGRWYALVPKVTIQSVFDLSPVGQGLQRSITSRYGNELQFFELKYVAQPIESYSIRSANSTQLWGQICQALFPLWDHLSPFKHIDEHQSDIVLFRVYSTESSIKKHIRNLRGRQPSIYRPFDVDKLSPVISNDEFDQQRKKLREILH